MKWTRMHVLLVIDVAFFFLELIAGLRYHSLALVADSFHMFNDVFSLLVGIWANHKLSVTTAPSYTYGYQRAGVLGGLVNGVALLALSVTIFLDAMQRFFEPQEVSNPKLVLVVGSCGLLSNIIGLLMFHDHGHGGHSHGGHSHGGVKAAEEGHAGHSHDSHGHSHSHDATVYNASHSANGKAEASAIPAPHAGSDSTAVEDAPASLSRSKRRHSRSASRPNPIPEEFPGPSQFRNKIIAAGQMPTLDSDDEGAIAGDDGPYATGENDESSALIPGRSHTSYGAADRKSFDHKGHNHKKSGRAGGGHSHGDLNAAGVFVHVLGDFFGNIGVIVSAILIWRLHSPQRFYADPAISMFISLIMIRSAYPLCKSATRILLQGVPLGLKEDEIREDIEHLPGITSVHEMHIWQLSESQTIASMHIRVGFTFTGEGSQRYMELAEAIKDCLHDYGIHSSTIQPEFTASASEAGHDDHDSAHGSGSRAASQRNVDACLLNCPETCEPGSSCCPPPRQQAHDHDSHDGHSH